MLWTLAERTHGGPCLGPAQSPLFAIAVNAETGLWCCHSQCGRGGSAYDLEMALTNADFRTAAQEVRRIVGTVYAGVALRAEESGSA